MPWDIEYPFPDVIEHIKGLQEPTRNKVVRALELLEEHGPRLPPPHSKMLGEGIHELRTSGSPPQRLYYAFQSGLRIVVLHAAVKGGGQRGGKRRQKADIGLARTRLQSLR